jgi:beta-glucosidase
VVQIYIKHIDSKVERPTKELKGFRRVSLKPGETKTVVIPVKTMNIAYWNKSKRSYIVEKDKIDVMVGSSSEDTRLEKIVEIEE